MNREETAFASTLANTTGFDEHKQNLGILSSFHLLFISCFEKLNLLKSPEVLANALWYWPEPWIICMDSTYSLGRPKKIEGLWTIRAIWFSQLLKSARLKSLKNELSRPLSKTLSLSSGSSPYPLLVPKTRNSSLSVGRINRNQWYIHLVKSN